MDNLTLEQIEHLQEHADGWCVSIYIPTHRAGKEIREDPVRLKNRIADAEQQLREAGVDDSDIDALCGEVRDLCDMDSEENREFWRHQNDGLAVFVASNGPKLLKVGASFDEKTVVARRFHVKPLLQALQGVGQYCLLAVSQNNVRFLEGSRSGLSARPVEELPESLQAVVRGDHQKGFNLHSFRVKSNGGENAVPHGHVDKNHEHELARYFRMIDEALHGVLENDQRPLVFAGVDELFPFFEEHVEYSNVLHESVSGNPDDLSDEQLHEKAWRLVEAYLADKRQEEISRWQEAAHTELGCTDLADILLAAHDGQIETLYVQTDANAWGTFHPVERRVSLAEKATAENYDLIDVAAVKTLRAGGRVVMSTDDNGPIAGEGAAAIFRFAAAAQTT